MLIRQRIALACARSGRDPAAVRIVAVAKNRTPQEIDSAVASGITDIGENRVQEALSKSAGLAHAGGLPPRISWHMIGHLQTNKVRDAVQLFDLIHSVDSLRLAQAIETCAAGSNKIQDILLQVNTSREATKYGVAPDAAAAHAAQIRALPHVRLMGLMTMAPIVDEPHKARPYFALLRRLLKDMNDASAESEPLEILSMGMSQDYEVAVEEGATLVRIGRAIFDT